MLDVRGERDGGKGWMKLGWQCCHVHYRRGKIKTLRRKFEGGLLRLGLRLLTVSAMHHGRDSQ